MSEKSTNPDNATNLDGDLVAEDSLTGVGRENGLHQIILRLERLFITDGLRMDFITPAVLLLVLGSSVAYAETSPSWWVDDLQTQTGTSLSAFLLFLSAFIILANIFLILILFLSLRLNISMFDEHEKAMSQRGMVMSNSHGSVSYTHLTLPTICSV